MSANDSMAVDWEQSKENFQPLKAGRKPDGLSDPLNIATGGSIDEQKQYVVINSTKHEDCMLLNRNLNMLQEIY